jgi:hypothetical protein
VEYLILVIALAMTCFAGVELCYLMFLQATIRQQRRRIRELEREIDLRRYAPAGEDAPAAADESADDEAWAEVIDDGTG